MTPGQITLKKCNEICAARNEIFQQILDTRRANGKHTAVLREICAYLRHEKKWTVTQIGRYLKRDHATITYHLKEKL